MINGLGPSQAAFVQPLQSASLNSAKAGNGPGFSAPGLQGDVKSQNPNGAQGLLNRLDSLRQVESSSSSTKASTKNELTSEEEQQVRALKERDAEVRAHEAAHLAAGGGFATGPSYDFTTGPDGRQYVTDGEVQIDTSPVANDPEATIAKLDVVIRSALAPAQPSSQDFAVARQAQQARTQAVIEAREADKAEEETGDEEEVSEGSDVQNQILQAIEAYQQPLQQAAGTDLSV